MRLRLGLMALLGSAALMIFAGCGNGGDSAGKQAGTQTGDKAATSDDSGKADNSSGADKQADKPVTLSFLQTSAKMTDDEFKAWVAGPVNKKYPNITLNLVREDNIDKLGELVASGSLPDIMYAGPVSAFNLVQLQAAEDLNGLAKANKVDVSKFDPSGLKVIQGLSDNGQLYAFPMGMNFSVLYYNKDIFDKFAVSYPKDGMTWDDAIELATKLSRSEGGQQYQGLLTDGNINRLGEQLSLPMVDVKTNKAVLQTDGWKRVFDLYKRIGQIPGNWVENKDRLNTFEKDRTLAMLAGLSARLGEFEQMDKQGQPMNWDMATMPAFPDKPKTSFGTSAYYLMMSSNGKHKDEAFKVLNLLTGDEVQTLLAKQGRQSGLKDQKYKDLFGNDLNSLKGKNKEAIFKMTPAPVPPTTKYDDLAFGQLVAAGNQIVKDTNLDVNTALRDAEEKTNKAIDAAKQ